MPSSLCSKLAFRLPVVPWFSLRSLCRSLCDSVWLFVALCGSLWFSVAFCGSLLLSLALFGSLLFYGGHPLDHVDSNFGFSYLNLQDHRSICFRNKNQREELSLELHKDLPYSPDPLAKSLIQLIRQCKVQAWPPNLLRPSFSSSSSSCL